MNWIHNVPPWVAVLVGLVLVYVLIKYTEGFQPEFLDQGNVIRTQETSQSSYAQRTNSVPVDGRFEAPPIQGIQSPFRVNKFYGFIP